jgi:hypothetical protein
MHCASNNKEDVEEYIAWLKKHRSTPLKDFLE